MLKEFRRYQNLGTPSYFIELLSALENNQNKNFTKRDLKKIFYNRVIDGRSVFDGCLELAIKIGFLVLQDDIVFLNSEIVGCSSDIVKLSYEFVKYLFNALKDDDEFREIFKSDYFSYDTTHEAFCVNNSAFRLKYSNLKQVLIDFGVLTTHPIAGLSSFIVNNQYMHLFDKFVLPAIKQREISVEEFRQSIEQQQIYGEEAEKYVLIFEFIRLNKRKRIDWVAGYVVNAGYDIASYNQESDQFPNRFIEVKSFDGDTPYFFWSRNEYSVAKRKKDEYWLYLVSRSNIQKDGYAPTMIQNPFETIFRDDENWDKQVEKYKVELTKKK